MSLISNNEVINTKISYPERRKGGRKRGQEGKKRGKNGKKGKEKEKKGKKKRKKEKKGRKSMIWRGGGGEENQRIGGK